VNAQFRTLKHGRVVSNKPANHRPSLATGSAIKADIARHVADDLRFLAKNNHCVLPQSVLHLCINPSIFSNHRIDLLSLRFTGSAESRITLTSHENDRFIEEKSASLQIREHASYWQKAPKKGGENFKANAGPLLALGLFSKMRPS
jgi:hypothetical protein